MVSLKFNRIKGMEDLVDSSQVKKWRFIEETARRLFATAGFEEIRTPMLEPLELFQRSVGQETDIVQKEMYVLQDRNGQALALRPENTAPVVRAFLEHFVSHQIHEGRFFYFGPMFRYERPQKGRYRQFHQLGLEIFGGSSPWLDAELIAAAWRFFAALQIPNFKLKINSLGSTIDRENFKRALQDFFDKAGEEQLCEDCQKRKVNNPLRLFDCKKAGCAEALAKAPKIVEALSPQSREHFEQIKLALQKLTIPFEIDHRLVRGLDYYNDIVFEFYSDDLGAQNSFAGGGRYDSLVADLGGPAINAVGFAVGLERLALLLTDAALPHSNPIKIYLLGLDKNSETFLFESLFKLRDSGLTTLLDVEASSLKSKMKRADRWKADWVVILGSSEREKGILLAKEMKTGEQQELALADFPQNFIAKISR